MGRKIIQTIGDVRGTTIAILGLTFKPNTDDMREAPSITIIQTLIDAGASVRAHDPEGMDQARQVLPDGVHYANDPYSVCDDADAVVLITEWESLRALDLAEVSRRLKRKIFVDLRNAYRPVEMTAQGFHYVSIGRAVGAQHITQR